MRVRDIQPDERGKGHTSEQMREAPRGALFIWCTVDVRYPKALARHLGRSDLEIVSPSILSEGAYRLRGRRLSGIIVDHAGQPNADERDLLDELRQMIVCAPENNS